jgi:AhpD family alkylhydroperoxidase
MVKPFDRRTYRSLSDALFDIRAVTTRRRQIRLLMRGEILSTAFRERLMLAVTEVNRCRYCAYYHAKQALVEGLSEEELQALTEGDFDRSPPEERAALLYAQHWAEANGDPDPAARERLRELYEPQVADAIELALQIIRVGNLMGNTWDGALHRLSAGRWGAS